MGISDPSWREWVLDEAASRPIDDAVERVANAHGVLPAQVALAWTVSRPGVIAPIFGPTKFEHVDAAVAALALKLEPAELQAIDAAYEPRVAGALD